MELNDEIREKISSAASVDEVVRICAEAGIPVTKEQLEASDTTGAEGELSEEALDAAHKGAGFAGTGAREYQHGVWPGLDGFLLRFGIRERLRIGRRLRCRGRHCREQGYLFRCWFLGRCRFGFSARFWGFGQSIQQG